MTVVIEHAFGRMRSAPGRCFNTNRGLTRSLDSTKEGLAMKATPSTCEPYTGRDSQFQAKAADAYFIHTATTPATWEWITTTCGTRCLNPDHMRFITPRKIRYPNGVCIYCGRRAGTKDHLIPRGWSGEAKRRWVAIVPACGTCNSLIGATLTWSITERRAICHARMRRRFRRDLLCIDRTPAELREYGPAMRSTILDGMAKKAAVEEMLAWPGGSDYDARALERSGIEDPWAAGLIISEDEANRIAREVCYTGAGDARRFYWNQWAS